MKNWGVLLLVLVIVAGGCAGTRIQRGVQGNYFYSTIPELALDLDPRLEYINKEASSEWNSFLYTERGTRHSYDRYMFADPFAQALVIVSIIKINEGYWSAPDMSKMKNVISSGYEKHLGSRYNFSVRVEKDENGECLLVKEYMRVSGGLGDILVDVIYLESTKDNCQNPDDWGLAVTHDPQKKQRLQEFLENTEKKLQFIDIKSLNLANNRTS